jgi:hypothetical protein
MQRARKKAGGAVFKRAKEFFKRVKEGIFPDSPFLGPVPAYAGAPCMPSSAPKDLFRPWMEFHTGDAPSSGSPSRKIMEWEPIDILEPGEKPRKNSITYKQAQKEVSKMLKTDDSCHQYLAYEAAKLCRAYPEATKHTLHLMAGAAAEDYFFRPGETLDDLHVRPPRRTFKSRRELSHAVGEPGEVPSFFGGLFRVVAKLWKRMRGSPDEDSINRPYFGHFYDPTRDEGDKGLNILHGDITFKSALHRMQSYWEVASALYVKGDRPNAFCALGHMIHLVQDLHVPAHVHNDIHGPTVFLGKLDSFESWCIRSDHPHITRPAKNENIRIWDSGGLAPPSPDRSWTPRNIRDKLKGFTDSFVQDTQNFRSVDAEGTGEDQGRKGKLTDDECYKQGSYLIPWAIFNSAQLIVNFLDYHQRIES